MIFTKQISEIGWQSHGDKSVAEKRMDAIATRAERLGFKVVYKIVFTKKLMRQIHDDIYQKVEGYQVGYKITLEYEGSYIKLWFKFRKLMAKNRSRCCGAKVYWWDYDKGYCKNCGERI